MEAKYTHRCIFNLLSPVQHHICLACTGDVVVVAYMCRLMCVHVHMCVYICISMLEYGMVCVKAVHKRGLNSTQKDCQHRLSSTAATKICLMS